jgi:hypothetical protein
MLEGRSAGRAARLEVRLEVTFAARLDVLLADFPCVDFCLNGFVATGSPPTKLRVANANRQSRANPALRGCACLLQGADWWIMRRDGSHKQRLTFMNWRGSPQSVGKFRLAGSLSFLSDQHFLGDVMTHSFGLVGKIVDVSINDGCVD